ncbi:hypothetical protein DAEQUDRAFT_410892 [Daedalea quercina L-15889]|uniref:U6 snRNA phosphodiesterase 1 n=1 Tax=Daedalea quercina L-15889 TaxID=1314783 RepID=A0A165NL18_9APHY|nr:hypothetical protein DAEQUDRAFT_410892 [Daedalea quercina L-15889]
MQRLVSLAQYGSSDEEETPSENSPPPAKRRKLPILPESLRPKAPIDNPALHQGRVRTSPHVEGQYAAYVYVPLTVERKSPLQKVLNTALASAQLSVPSLQAIGLPDRPQAGSSHTQPHDLEDPSDSCVELHISLTRPIYLRAHQREDLKRAVKMIARSHLTFHASLASFSELTNDEQTRTFLAVEIGAGHDHLKSMSDGLVPTLQSLKQKEFYAEPRFHASFAWALLHSPPFPEATSEASPSAPASSPGPTPALTPSNDEGTAAESSTVNLLGAANVFPTIPRFPSTLVPTLNADFGETLRTRHVGTFDVRELHVKIGKDVFKWALAGS